MRKNNVPPIKTEEIVDLNEIAMGSDDAELPEELSFRPGDIPGDVGDEIAGFEHIHHPDREFPESPGAGSADNIWAGNGDNMLSGNEKGLMAREDRERPSCLQWTIIFLCIIFAVIAWSILDPFIHKSIPTFAPFPPFSTPQSEIPWAHQVSMITSTSFAPLYARFSVIYGRKPLFILALTLLVVGEGLCAVAEGNFAAIIALKAIAGAGGGGIFPLAFIIISDVEPDIPSRAKHTAPWALVFTIASMLVPHIGKGLVTWNRDLWRYVFIIPLLFGIIGFLFALILPSRRLHRGEKREGAKIDWRGALLIFLGIACILVAIAWSSQAKVAQDAVQTASDTVNSAASSIKAATSNAAASAQAATSNAAASAKAATSNAAASAQAATSNAAASAQAATSNAAASAQAATSNAAASVQAATSSAAASVQAAASSVSAAAAALTPTSAPALKARQFEHHKHHKGDNCGMSDDGDDDDDDGDDDDDDDDDNGNNGNGNNGNGNDDNTTTDDVGTTAAPHVAFVTETLTAVDTITTVTAPVAIETNNIVTVFVTKTAYITEVASETIFATTLVTLASIITNTGATPAVTTSYYTTLETLTSVVPITSVVPFTSVLPFTSVVSPNSYSPSPSGTVVTTGNFSTFASASTSPTLSSTLYAAGPAASSIALSNYYSYNQPDFNLSSYPGSSAYALLANTQCQAVVPYINQTAGANEGASDGVSHTTWVAVLVTLFVVGTALVSYFVSVEHNQGEHEAIIPLRIFTNKILVTIFVTEILFGATFAGLQNFLPIYYNELDCNTGNVSKLNTLYPVLGSSFAAALFVYILTRYHLYRITSIVGAVLMLVGTIMLRVTIGNPEQDTHVTDGASIFIACVAVVIIFQTLTLWAQSKVKEEEDENGEDKNKDIRDIVTGLTMCFFMFGMAFGYSVTTSMFTNVVVSALSDAGISEEVADMIVSMKSIPHSAASPVVIKAYVNGLAFVYHGFCIPATALSVVLLVGTYIWARKDAMGDR